MSKTYTLPPSFADSTQGGWEFGQLLIGDYWHITRRKGGAYQRTKRGTLGGIETSNMHLETIKKVPGYVEWVDVFDNKPSAGPKRQAKPTPLAYQYSPSAAYKPVHASYVGTITKEGLAPAPYKEDLPDKVCKRNPCPHKELLYRMAYGGTSTGRSVNSAPAFQEVPRLPSANFDILDEQVGYDMGNVPVTTVANAKKVDPVKLDAAALEAMMMRLVLSDLKGFMYGGNSMIRLDPWPVIRPDYI